MTPEIQAYIDQKFAACERAIRAHMHNGLDSQQINVADLFGRLPTVTDATTLTNVTAAAPTAVAQQFFIDTSTATKKLYVYDVAGRAWLSVTIA